MTAAENSMMMITFLLLNCALANEHSNGMQVFVRQSQGQLHAVTVPTEATVADILQNLCIEDHVAEHSIISHQGADLSPDDLLADVGICAESVVCMRVALHLEFRQFYGSSNSLIIQRAAFNATGWSE